MPNTITEPRIYAMIDSLGGVGAALKVQHGGAMAVAGDESGIAHHGGVPAG